MSAYRTTGMLRRYRYLFWPIPYDWWICNKKGPNNARFRMLKMRFGGPFFFPFSLPLQNFIFLFFKLEIILRMDPTKAMPLLTKACPYLARTGLSVLQGMANINAATSARPLSTSAADKARCSVCPGHTGQSALLAKASECPVVGPSIRNNNSNNAEQQSANPSPAKATAAACPFAKCADKGKNQPPHYFCFFYLICGCVYIPFGPLLHSVSPHICNFFRC